MFSTQKKGDSHSLKYYHSTEYDTNPAIDQTYVQAIWDHYKVPNYNEMLEHVRQNQENKETYKLHISIHPYAFNKSKDRIHHILHQALDQRIFLAYKTYVEAINPDERQRHAPFTIYIDFLDDNHLRELAKVCSQIENALKNILAGNSQACSRCDIIFTDHIIFRQESLDGNYVPARNSTDASQDRLLHEGFHSECLRKLRMYYPGATLVTKPNILQIPSTQCMFSTSEILKVSVSKEDTKKPCITM